MNTFPPKPGTVAYRVLAHLETILPRRPRATVGMIAGDLRGFTPSQVRDACEVAHAEGYLNRSHEVSSTGRGPVFYELVRRTTGELALSAAHAVDEPEPVADHIPTGTALPPGGVLEPVVDPHPPVVDAPPAALAQVVNIRRVAPAEAADVDLPPLGDWLRAAHGVPLERGGAVAHGAVAADPDPRHVHIPAVSLSFDLAKEPLPAATETPPQVTVALDFAPGPDQFSVAVSSDGRLHCWRGVVPYVFSREEARALVAYLNRVDLDELLTEAP